MTNNSQNENSIDILLDVKKQFFSHVKLRLDSFFDSLKGILFVFEQNAGEDYKQSLNNVAIKSVIKHRKSIEKNFFASLDSAFTYCFEGNYDFFINENLTIRNYQQVITKQNEDDEMAIISMLINQSDDNNEENLNILGNMFSELISDKSLTINQIPLSPFVLVNSLVNSIKNLDLNSAIRMIVYHTFEVNVLSKLNTVYGKLLQIHKGTIYSLSPREDIPVIRTTPDLKFKIIRKLFDNSHKNLQLKSDKKFAVEKHFLVKTINIVQLHIVKKYDSKINDYPAPKNIKKILDRAMIRSKEKINSAQLDPRHVDMIVLVERLFDYIEKDQGVPLALKLILMKLQTSILKVVIKDNHVFKCQNHPLRLLVNQMSFVPEGFSDELNSDHRYVVKLEEIAAVILVQATYNVELYKNLLSELNQFTMKMSRRFKLIQKRVKEKAVGLEKILQIKQKVAKILHDKMHDKYMPVFIRDLLLSTWKNVLVLEFLRHPEKSKTCQSKLKFIDVLLEYSKQINNKVVTNKQIKLLSIQYNEGLDLVAFNAKDLIDKNNELIGFLIKLHGLEKQPDEIKDVSLRNYNTQVVLFEKLEAHEGVNSTGKKVLLDSFDKRAKALKVGDWLNIQNKATKKIRAKISWVSPITGRYLLVNSNGVRLSDQSPKEIAIGLRDKKISILHSIPLFDRAMLEIAKKMNQERQ